jgi:hypothetical protein
MMPGNVWFASGLIIGLAMGIGASGPAVNGTIADQVSLDAALGTIPLPILAALVSLFCLCRTRGSREEIFERTKNDERPPAAGGGQR